MGTAKIVNYLSRCIDPEEDRVALVIGGNTRSNGFKNIEVYLTANVKGTGYKYNLIVPFNKCPEQVANTSKVLRTGMPCTNHTLPDLPVVFNMANAAYLKDTLYVCGGYIPEEGTGVKGDVF